MWQGLLYFQKKYVKVLYMCFHNDRVVFCAAIPMGPRTPNFASYSMSYIAFKLHGEDIRASQALPITI